MAVTHFTVDDAIERLDRSLTNYETMMLYNIVPRESTIWENTNQTEVTPEILDLVIQTMLYAYQRAITDVDRECRFRVENMTSY